MPAALRRRRPQVPHTSPRLDHLRWMSRWTWPVRCPWPSLANASSCGLGACRVGPELGARRDYPELGGGSAVVLGCRDDNQRGGLGERDSGRRGLVPGRVDECCCTPPGGNGFGIDRSDDLLHDRLRRYAVASLLRRSSTGPGPATLRCRSRAWPIRDVHAVQTATFVLVRSIVMSFQQPREWSRPGVCRDKSRDSRWCPAREHSS